VSVLWLVVGLVAAQRLAELAHARRNTRRLLARGAREAAPGHYPLLVLLHAAWLAALALLVPSDAPVAWPLLGLYALLQAARAWAIWSLGEWWTTRIVTLPGAPLVRRGPYRWLEHPNYWIVALEIPLLPLAFGAAGLALAFGAANLALLAVRVRAENAALAGRRLASSRGSLINPADGG
jgi:methyltransferase